MVGAGTMGAGIAQLGCAAGMRTLLHDPIPEALERGAEKTRGGLAKWAEKGRVDEDAAGLLETVDSIEALAPCELVIEAAPERIELKRELFGKLSEACGEDAVLATNTSSITVTAIAGAAARPENVVGMHFFNPPPLMKLLEVIRADQTGERALSMARDTGEAMGKHVIVAADGPGFLVNRGGRPFYTEALRSLQEGQATHEQIDRVCRLGGGFPMGPFELMDMVGIDVGFEVAKSFDELSFGEPRWRPNPIQARLVAAGRLGRKTGEGYYDYSREPYRPDDPDPPERRGGDGRAIALTGEGKLVDDLRERASSAGFELGAQDAEVELCLCAGRSLAAQADRGERSVGFYALALEDSRLVELTRLPGSSDEAAAAAERFFASLGFHHEWVGDAPGLVLGRIVCGLVNEAAFAIGEGIGSAEDVDAGLELGLSHPRGPVGWGERIGLDHVLEVIDGLFAERHEERYRAAPLLRRAVALGVGLRA
ncbi:MAG: 3-hydroxyacyl-CoA dehydrogenase NAD-binding domain-containing protein [Thermoleophilaceae bacterium]